MVTEQIQHMLADYFETLYTQDLTMFDKVFHPGCVLYTSQEGTVVVRPIAEYRGIVAGRKSPKELGSPRKDEILMIDVISVVLPLPAACLINTPGRKRMPTIIGSSCRLIPTV
jgi:hypothetical protein